VEALKFCIEKLPEKQREVIVARYLDAESVTGIAKDLGTNANAVSQTLFRARANLAKCVTAETAKTIQPF
ncbi:MAG: sigma-70 family RNA polymerase sigma factor, partial [Verrucomicrobiales bacterium]|nr:sigma-70 family RNA polymerase sigma factor [Verrucomicrobiales bacterium]